MNPLFPQGVSVPGAPPAPGIVAPGRESYRIVRKVLPDGRILDFVWLATTHATAQGTYLTWELVEAPTLACSCTAREPDDVVVCSQCGAVVCARRHAGTCMECGRLACSACLTGVNVKGVWAVTCRACAQSLNASALQKVWRGLSGLIWGQR